MPQNRYPIAIFGRISNWGLKIYLQSENISNGVKILFIRYFCLIIKGENSLWIKLKIKYENEIY